MIRALNPLLLVVVMMLPGCAHQGTLHPGPENSSALQRWMEVELEPYLAGQLSQHPRFKGEPLLLVSLAGPDIQADIDGLTRSIRDQLRDGLLQTPGVRLAWQPHQQQARHHRRLDQVKCEKIRDASYYIGIEVARTSTAQFRVSLRALDVRAGEWVSGFGMNWLGSLTASELRALQERRTDESLRGLRMLPFSSGHPDLAATYLANNLSCLLRYQDEEDLVIHVEALKSDKPGLRTLLDLVGNNLSRYREVRVTDARKEANFILRGEAHRIRTDLYQVWVVLHPRHSGEHLAGMDTATYVRILPAGQPPAATAVVRYGGDGRPAIARMELVRRHPGSTDSASCAPAAGHTTACRLLELSVRDAGRVYVFAHGPGTGFVRLAPGACRHVVEPAGDSAASYTYQLPEVRPAEAAGHTLYAIAVNGAEPERRAGQLLGELPDACSDTASLQMDERRLDRWLNELDRLIALHGNQVAWTARRIP